MIDIHFNDLGYSLLMHREPDDGHLSLILRLDDGSDPTEILLADGQQADMIPKLQTLISGLVKIRRRIE